MAVYSCKMIHILELSEWKEFCEVPRPDTHIVVTVKKKSWSKWSASYYKNDLEAKSASLL